MKDIAIGIRDQTIVLTIETPSGVFEFQFSGEDGLDRAIATLNKGRIRFLIENAPD